MIMRRTNALKEKLKVLVSSIYSSEFKIFDVNSENNKFNPEIKDQYFISFGLTTSLQVLRGLFKDLLEIDNSLNLEIVEITSKKLSQSYLNSVSSEDPDEQFDAEVTEFTLNKEQAENKLKELKEIESPLAIKLEESINNLNNSNGWLRHLLLVNEETDTCQLYHKYINYKKEGDLEYRIGILVKF